MEASAALDFHSSYRAEQGELPTRKWKPNVSFRKTRFLRRSRQAVTKSPATTKLFRYLRGRMNGAFLWGKKALLNQNTISRLTRRIHEGLQLPGCMQCPLIETGAVAGP